jgi:hypothetical protein
MPQSHKMYRYSFIISFRNLETHGFQPHENTNSNDGEYGIIRDMGLPGMYLINTDLIPSEVHNPIRGALLAEWLSWSKHQHE